VPFYSLNIRSELSRMNSQGYTPVPLNEEAPTPAPQSLSEAEKCMVSRSRKWVIFTSLLQLVMNAFFFLIAAGYWLIIPIVSSIFISFGIVGAARQRPRMLIAHHVYSLLLYILSLVALILMILYCDHCYWAIYVGAFLLVLFQAIGLRHSRMLIRLTYKSNGGCVWRCARWRRCQRDQACQNTQTQTQMPEITPVLATAAPGSAPSAPVAPAPAYIPMYFAYPQQGQQPQQFQQFQQLPPNYFPMQPMQQMQPMPYPMQVAPQYKQ